jgi:hypothetical protein
MEEGKVLPGYTRRLQSRFASIGPYPTLQEVTSNIALASVLRWENWFSSHSGRTVGRLVFYKMNASGHYTGGHRRNIPELAHLTTCKTIRDWTCDIRDVEGLACSKAPLGDLFSCDEMAEVYAAQYIQPLSEQNLLRNLNHDEIRILHRKNGGGDFFVRYLWDDGRIYLVNTGGSHHFVAARYIAAKISMKVPLHGLLHIYSFNMESMFSLLQSYRIFMLEKQQAEILFATMSSCRVEYGKCSLPNPCGNFYAVFLPVDEQRSTAIAEIMYDAGIFSLSDYFLKKINMPPVFRAK